jgi:hypothetical protein
VCISKKSVNDSTTLDTLNGSYLPSRYLNIMDVSNGNRILCNFVFLNTKISTVATKSIFVISVQFLLCLFISYFLCIYIDY